MGGTVDKWFRKFLKRPTQAKPSYIPGNNARDWNNYETGFSSQRNYKEAIRCYDKALEFDPGDFSAWHNKGMALSGLGHYQDAIGCFDKALAITPEAWNTWEQKGLSYERLGRQAEADACRKKALRMEVKSHLND